MAISRHNLVPDLPDNNFATFNPLNVRNSSNLSEGNLKFSSVLTNSGEAATATMSLPNYGKYYLEAFFKDPLDRFSRACFGITGIPNNAASENWIFFQSESYGQTARTDVDYGFMKEGEWFRKDGDALDYVEGGIYQLFYDADSLKLWIGRDNIWHSSTGPISGTPNFSTDETMQVSAEVAKKGLFPFIETASEVGLKKRIFFNFGQNPDFCREKTDYSGGNNPDGSWSDANGIGRFYYQPPAGALALCSRNLQPAASFAGYDFEETGKALTYSGNVEISKNSPYIPSGSYISPNPVDDRINFSTQGDWTLPGDFTIEMLVKQNGNGSDSSLYVMSDGSSYFAFNFESSSNKYNLYLNSGGASTAPIAQNLCINAWNHLVLIRKDGYICLYENGVKNTNLGDYNNSSILGYSEGSVALNRLAGGGGSPPITMWGAIRITREAIYDTSLSVLSDVNHKFERTENTILLFDGSSNPDFSSFSGNAGFVPTSPFNTPAKQRANALTGFGGGSYAFSTGEEGIEVPGTDIFDGNTLTIEFWLKFNGTDTRRIMSCYNDGNDVWEIAFDGYWGIYFRHWENNTMNINQGLYDQWSASNNWQPNVWTHIVFQKNDSTWSFYKDGKSISLDGTSTAQSSNAGDSLAIANFNTLVIGNFKGMDDGLTAGDYIANIHVTKEAKYTGETFDVPTEPITATENTTLLTSPYKMKEGFGNFNSRIVPDNSKERSSHEKEIQFYNSDLTLVDSGPVSGLASYRTGSIKRAGTNDLYGTSCIYVPNGPEYDIAANEDFTIEFWMNVHRWPVPDKDNAYVMFRSRSDASNGDSASNSHRVWGLHLISSNTSDNDPGVDGFCMLCFGSLSSAMPGRSGNVQGDENINKWHHFVYMRKGNTTYSFINGQVRETKSGTASVSAINSTYGDMVFLGGQGMNTNETSMADIRMVKGQAVYDEAGFDVPTEPLSNAGITGTVAFHVQPRNVVEIEGFSAAENPEQHFKSILWSGDSEVNRQISTEFQPDLVWLKARTHSNPSLIFDSVRGFEKSLAPDQQTKPDDMRDSEFGYVSAVSQTDFTITLGSNNSERVNATGRDYVAWTWKAGGAPADGKMMKDGEELDVLSGGITPKKMSVNTKAGFSIINYEGNEGGTTIPHGLNRAPDFVIIKGIDNSYDWVVRHSGVDDSSMNEARFFLNTNDRLMGSQGNGPWNSTAPDNQFIHIGPHLNVNEGGKDFICYAWHAVPGYSSFGHYIGTASPQFIYTGFKPAFLMAFEYSFSNRTYSSWLMYDNAREPHNEISKNLHANIAREEGKRMNGDAGVEELEFLSNGFRVISGNVNANGDAHIYIAFAETPLNFANAR